MRLKNRYVAVLTVFTLFIAGCSNNLIGRTPGDGKTEGTVTFSVGDIPPNYAEMILQAQNPASRSILPNAPFTSTSGLKFVLTGTSDIGTEFTATEVTLDSSLQFKTVLSAHIWDLTLTAYKGNLSDNKKVLVGHCMVDVTHNNGTAQFVMSTKGLTTPGTVKITGSVLDPNNICTKYTIGIYDAYSREPIAQYTDVNVPPSQHPTNAEQTKNTGTHSGSFDFHYGDTTAGDLEVTLNPGAYAFLMVFYKQVGSNYIPIGHYPDTIVVNPGNDLERDLGSLDVLEKVPGKPNNLRAYRVNGSEDTEGSYYRTKLTWDSGQFETNYELELSTYPGDGSGTPEKQIYGFETTAPSTPPPPSIENFAGSSIRYGGSLISGSTECTLKLELGKVYEVRLRSRNYIGESAWVERVDTPASPAPANCTLFGIPTTAEPNKHINRRRIRYNLNGGTLTIGGTPKTGTYIVYDSYEGAAKDLLKIEKSLPPAPPPPSGANTLTRPPADFRAWLNPNTGAVVSHDHAHPTAPSDADFYKYVNVDLTTDFGNGLEGTVTMPNAETDIPDGKIKITYDKDGGTTHHTPTTSGSHLVIKKRVGTDISFITVEFDPAVTPEYTHMECTAYFKAGSGVSAVDFLPAADGMSCTFSTGTYPTQIFTLKVSGRDSHGALRSKTFLIDLVN